MHIRTHKTDKMNIANEKEEDTLFFFNKFNALANAEGQTARDFSS